MVQKDGNNTRPDAAQETTGLKNNIAGTEKQPSAHIENAHASGIGAMGRNDEKLPTGAEEEGLRPDEPVY